MKKLNKKIVSVIAVALLTLPIGISASAYTIDNTYQLTLNEGDSRRAVNKFVVLHDVGTESSALNNAIYMKRAWSQTESYTQFIVGDGGKVYKVGEDGYVSWGAGSYVNANAPVQIELAHTYDKATFDQDYAVYVNLTRDYAIKYGIPLTLDAGNMYTSGIKSHLWVTNNVWGDHTDPYGYLARFGVTKEKLAADLQTGLSEGTSTISPAPINVNLQRAAIKNLSPHSASVLKTRFIQEFGPQGKNIVSEEDITINYRDGGSSAIVMVNNVSEGVANWLRSIWTVQYVNGEKLIDDSSVYVEPTIDPVFDVEFKGLNLNDARNIRNELRRDFGSAGVRYMQNHEFIVDGSGQVVIKNISYPNARELVKQFQDDYAINRKLLPTSNIQGVKH